MGEEYLNKKLIQNLKVGHCQMTVMYVFNEKKDIMHKKINERITALKKTKEKNTHIHSNNIIIP